MFQDPKGQETMVPTYGIAAPAFYFPQVILPHISELSYIFSEIDNSLLQNRILL